MLSPENPKPPELPSEGVRGIVSLLLVVHLFAIVVVLGSYTSASMLQRQLAATLRLYTRTLNFDLTHVFPAVARLHLTHAGPSDVDFTITGTANLKGGTKQPWQLPRPGLFPPIRANRDQALANVVGGLMDEENDEQESLLPLALASAELRKAGAKSGSITVTAHYLLELEDLNAPETNRRNPFDASYFRNVFQANVIAERNGRFSLLKSVGKGEVAPVTGASGNTSKSTEPASKKE
jgi:hypothetical protein